MYVIIRETTRRTRERQAKTNKKKKNGATLTYVRENLNLLKRYLRKSVWVSIQNQ
jgi:hypothetical protein